MRKGVHQYPFQGKMMSIPEISRHYNKKGIELNYSMLVAEVKKIADRVGRENVTEEQILEAVKCVLSKKNLATMLPKYKENCINEFGQKFWDDLLARKEDIVQARKFRLSMKVNLNETKEKNIKNKTGKDNERSIEDGGAR